MESARCRSGRGTHQRHVRCRRRHVACTVTGKLVKTGRKESARNLCSSNIAYQCVVRRDLCRKAWIRGCQYLAVSHRWLDWRVNRRLDVRQSKKHMASPCLCVVCHLRRHPRVDWVTNCCQASFFGPSKPANSRRELPV